MASSLKFPSYYSLVGALVIVITIYYISEMRSTNAGLKGKVTYFKDLYTTAREKGQLQVKDLHQKLYEKAQRIKQLDQENMSKHTALGDLNGKMAALRHDVESKSREIKKLRLLASSHKKEISSLQESLAQSKGALRKLSNKADNLMSHHVQLKQEKNGLLKRNENLQNEVKQHQSQRGDDMERLMKKNKQLSEMVDDLIKKNNVMQENFKQKIRDSYGRRVMHPRRSADTRRKVNEDDEDRDGTNKSSKEVAGNTTTDDEKVSNNRIRYSSEALVPTDSKKVGQVDGQNPERNSDSTARLGVTADQDNSRVVNNDNSETLDSDAKVRSTLLFEKKTNAENGGIIQRNTSENKLHQQADDEELDH